jgi:hypothetical protein
LLPRDYLADGSRTPDDGNVAKRGLPRARIRERAC